MLCARYYLRKQRKSVIVILRNLTQKDDGHTKAKTVAVIRQQPITLARRGGYLVTVVVWTMLMFCPCSDMITEVLRGDAASALSGAM